MMFRNPLAWVVVLACSLSPAGCNRKREFTPSDIQAALRADHWSLSEHGPDTRLLDPSIGSECFDAEKGAAHASICVWRCHVAACAAARESLAKIAPKSSRSVDWYGSSVLVVDDCEGGAAECNALNRAIATATSTRGC